MLHVPFLSTSGVRIDVVGLVVSTETDEVRVNSPDDRGETMTAVAFLGEASVRPEVGVCGDCGPFGELRGIPLP